MVARWVRMTCLASPKEGTHPLLIHTYGTQHITITVFSTFNTGPGAGPG